MHAPSLIKDFQNQLHNIEKSSWDIIKKSTAAIEVCRKYLQIFKCEVVSKGFSKEEDKIQFFKNIKQIPLSYLIYYLEVYAFESQLSKTSEKMQQKFIKKNINRRHQFLVNHLDFVNYIEQGQTHLDVCYFTRNQSIQIMMMHTDYYFYDLDFNTSHDLLLAKINAYKRFISYLEDRSNCYSNPSSHSNLKWTSSKVALTELIYALYHSRVINNGKLEIKEIAIELQKLFNFELGDFYKTYSEIRLRKNSRTKFLDELSIGLINEIEKNDS
ncbi:RteC domain-containing protein [Flavivirga jejuensis]|uniref:RteC domain-containing protein n=1 Tax=Flavivirga jejuensis TaxID=870487 RepID=A0ABT8WVI5_9FLAO|nr:RteC domain-containing protein [Flavivirga jejuensis]MDO5977168.1 RteC domain-containing protein [Flavivirga jejuensis]